MAKLWRPEPPRRKRRGGGVWGFISFLVSVFVIGAAAVLVAAFAFIAESNRAGPGTQAATFIVQHGQSAATIGANLERAHEVRNALVFRVATRAYAQGKTLKEGEYAIPAGATLRAVVQMMANGDALQHPITFPEGITVEAAMRIIAASDVLTGDMPAPPPEGSILPETYNVERGMTRAALLQQMQDARNHAVDEIWAARQPNLPLNSQEELVTLASIVERETGVATERPMVAAVFVNRLKMPMRLESDPTIIYGVCKRFPDRCRDGRLVDAQGHVRVIRQSEIALDTGYNTYRIDRLPPTPISNPGRQSLEAVAHPADSNALFFVANGTGGHVFAATVEEHNANVARWRQIEAVRLAQERAGQ